MDSNHRRLRLQRSALPLSYLGIRVLERTARIELATTSLATKHSATELRPHWWVGTELNGHSLRGAFTAPWARQCPADPLFGCRPGGRTRLNAAYETAWITNRSACINGRRGVT